MAAELVAKAGVAREQGWLYFVDKKGNISRARMVRGGERKKGEPELVKKVGVSREEGYLYYVDKSGDISRTKMSRGGTARKKKAAAKAAPAKKRATAGGGGNTEARGKSGLRMDRGAGQRPVGEIPEESATEKDRPHVTLRVRVKR